METDNTVENVKNITYNTFEFNICYVIQQISMALMSYQRSSDTVGCYILTKYYLLTHTRWLEESFI